MREGALAEFDVHPVCGEVYRLGENPACRFLFRKLSRLARLCQTLRPDIVHAHQIEFPVTGFRRLSRLDTPILVHAHSVRSFRAEFGVADRYLAVS